MDYFFRLLTSTLNVKHVGDGTKGSGIEDGCMSDRWDSGRITGDECNGYSDMHEGMKDGSVCMLRCT